MFETPSLFAYIDPATGSIVLQVIVAGMLSAGIFFRRIFVSPLNQLLGRNKPKSNSADASEDAS